jgi:hypothetical protein
MNPRTLRTPSLNRVSLLLLASGTAVLLALPAHAVGRLADIQVVDRETGQQLPVYRHQGDYWVPGRPGARYAVSVRNATQERVLGVISVDGVNVISGETAAWDQTGYVLWGRQQYQITGWRKSDSEVAAFHFTAAQASYAARTGRPDHTGVIGVAVFREKVAPPPPPVLLPSPRPLPYGHSRERSSESLGDESVQSRSAAPSAAERRTDSAGPQRMEEAPAAEALGNAAGDMQAKSARRMAPAAPAPRLGTGHGAREDSQISHTSFERRGERPDEVIRIRYDSEANLIAMGIIPTALTPPRPNPFPGYVQPGYSPDPM